MKKFKRSFRKNKRIKHPTYVVDENGNLYRYIGVTHSRITKGKENVPLHNNPDPNDKKRAYMIPQVDTDERKNFGRRYKNWRLSEIDKKKVKEIIKNEKSPENKSEHKKRKKHLRSYK